MYILLAAFALALPIIFCVVIIFIFSAKEEGENKQ